MHLVTSVESPELRLEPGDRDEMIAKEAVEAFFAVVVRKCRMLMGADYAPAAVSLMRPDPGCDEAYREALGVTPRFSARRNAICFRSAGLDDPLPAGNPELAAELDKISERYLASIDPKTIAASVRKILEDIMPSGRPTLVAVARLMNRSEKTVQRSLDSEGTNFQEVLERTRLSLALKYIGDKRLSLSHIAQLLGFSDQSNFTRAFRRWTHYSPGDYRNIKGS